MTDSYDFQTNAVKRAHLAQATTHLVDAIANIQSAVYAGGTDSKDSQWVNERLLAPLKGVMAECAAEQLHLAREFEEKMTNQPDVNRSGDQRGAAL